MTTTTYYAAIDKSNTTGAIYGVGTTREAALTAALEPGDPCVAHEERAEGHSASDHFAIVTCSPAAAAYVDRHGGAPDPELQVSLHPLPDLSPYCVWLRSEE